MDKNIYLIQFKNGVYDLQSNQFRQRSNGDITEYINYDYVENPEYMDETWDIINKIFVNRAIRDYFLKVCAITLSGEKVNRFFILHGSGCNGKSLLMNLLMMTLECYTYMIPSLFLSGNKKKMEKIKCD